MVLITVVLILLDSATAFVFPAFNLIPFEAIHFHLDMPHFAVDNLPSIRPSEFLASTDPSGLADQFTLTVPQMARKEGFESEEFSVTTPDGYILKVHRVQEPSNELMRKPVVFIQHGLLCSAAEWVIGSHKNSLAFLLANEGYDVWLGNFRGNLYSRGHISLNVTNDAYWDFSWDEMAKYDLPTMLNHTLNVTRQESLIYIGHSMGTTAMFAMTTLYPQYANKVIKMATLLAPVAAIPNMSSPIRFLFSPMNVIVRSFGLNEFMPPKNFLQLLSLYVCKHGSNPLCEIATASTMFFLSGLNWPHLNQTLVPYIAGHSPAGTSSHTVLHFVQMYKSKGFHSYDGGPDYNLKKHGNTIPIKYSVSRARFPTAVYWSDHDWFATPKDVRLSVLKQLPNVIDAAQVPTTMFNHVDFLYANDIKNILYDRVISTLNKFK